MTQIGYKQNILKIKTNYNKTKTNFFIIYKMVVMKLPAIGHKSWKKYKGKNVYS